MKAVLNPKIMIKCAHKEVIISMTYVGGKYGKEYRINKHAEIAEFLYKIGYTLIDDEYINNRTPMNVICSNGHQYKATWDALRQKKLCRICYIDDMKKGTFVKKEVKNRRKQMSLQERFENVKRTIEAEGYTIKTDHYINNKTMFKVICPEGHEYDTNWNRFQTGKRCKVCYWQRIVKSTEEINEELLLQGCEIIGEYNGSEKPFKYRCSCGNISKTRIGDFRRGVRCSRCSGEKARETLRKKRVDLLRAYDSNKEV